MSSETESTTLRLLNHFSRPCATRPSMSVRAHFRRASRGRLAVLLAVLLRVEDALDPLLLAAFHDRAVLGDVDRDRVARDDVVVLPDPRVADEHDALVEVEVFGALSRAGAAVLGDDPHGSGRDRPQNPVALLVHVDLDPVGVLHGVVPARNDVAAEDDQAGLAEPPHLVRVHGERQRVVVLADLRLGCGRRLVGGGRRGFRRRGLRRGLPARHRGRQHHEKSRQDRRRPHWRPPVNTAWTRPAKVVYSSAIRTSSAEPSATVPPREIRTGASVQSRFSAPCQRSTLVSRRTPSLDVSTTVFRISRFLVAWNRSPSSPTIVHDRSRSSTSTAIVRSAVRPSASNIRACSALSRQRTPPVTSSIWASLIRRSALDATVPTGSLGGTRLFAINVPATANTKTTTIPRIAAATNRVLIALSILKVSRTGMQFRYHAITLWRRKKARTP